MKKNKFKFPKTIEIMHDVYSITYKEGTYGGTLDTEIKEITVGLDWKKEEDIFAVLVHEISEVIHIELFNRYYSEGTDSYIFNYKHDKFTTHNSILSKIIYKLMNNGK